MSAERPGSQIESAGERYAAKLLFQFRVVVDGHDNVMRDCEERIVVLRAPSAREALHRVKRYGQLESCTWRNDKDDPVHFEFVGVLDLQHLGSEAEEQEVWYDIVVRKTPMERAERLLPPEDRLSALRNERSAGGRRISRATLPVRPICKTTP